MPRRTADFHLRPCARAALLMLLGLAHAAADAELQIWDGNGDDTR